MTNLQTALSFLGQPYELKSIDLEKVIYRKLPNGYELEVSGISGRSKSCTIYVWNPNREIVSIYSGITYPETLKDILGYLSFKYQNLISQIQVEREDRIE